MRIRRTTLADAARLPQVERSAGAAFRTVPGLAWIAEDDVLTEEEHRALILDGACWVSVDEADVPFGFISAQVVGDELHIWELSVSLPHQGAGAGSALLRTAIDHARGEGLRGVTLTTFTDVPWNAPYYERLGFMIQAQLSADERLNALLEDEYARGLPRGSRCAMRLGL